MIFDDAFRILQLWEGGSKLTNDPKDPGGTTRYGISQKAYPGLDIINLTESEAKAIFKRDYWDKMRCNEIHPKLRLVLFDTSINLGADWTTRAMQKILNIRVDGIFGPATLNALGIKNVREFTFELLADRLFYYTKLTHFPRYGIGWFRRTIDIAMMR